MLKFNEKMIGLKFHVNGIKDAIYYITEDGELKKRCKRKEMISAVISTLNLDILYKEYKFNPSNFEDIKIFEIVSDTIMGLKSGTLTDFDYFYNLCIENLEGNVLELPPDSNIIGKYIESEFTRFTIRRNGIWIDYTNDASIYNYVDAEWSLPRLEKCTFFIKYEWLYTDNEELMYWNNSRSYQKETLATHLSKYMFSYNDREYEDVNEIFTNEDGNETTIEEFVNLLKNHLQQV